MKGGYTDNYYMQMAQNIRRYKGVRPIPELNGLHPDQNRRRFRDWSEVDVEYRDTVGDTVHRDYDGYGGLHYKNDSGRNDIVTCKVAVDDDQRLFLRRNQRTAHAAHRQQLDAPADRRRPEPQHRLVRL